ncbi:hypothetical protein D8674_012564 [Pyrus ussuriensis x Pyrus communis]|uniref:Exonuclease domain-containing protein n=1 Tax=Pyrus ussuriensis x Pyrus communis TaxID=2448454 RepID=A0A5N5G201_9ROSA|nr:hypothetical protein D8674_012564 [Pyrus ussuriensis x Pyrus communis]
MASRSEDRCEIAFFDLETTMPTRTCQDCTILEFGSILVCPRKLVELDSYFTLVQPADPSVISSLPDRRNGITRAALVDAPFFQDIADRVYDILHGRIWAGHNILEFDCPRIREAFAQIGRRAPEPKDTIDSLKFLRQRFGRRAGDMKMQSLATYFGLGDQPHRSLGDVRMNLEVLKCCAAVLFLESSLPDIFKKNSWVPSNANTRICSENTERVSNVVESSTARPYAFDMDPLRYEVMQELNQPDNAMVEIPMQKSVESSSPFAASGSSHGTMEFLQPDEVSIPFIHATLVPLYNGSPRIKLLHKDETLQLCCRHMELRFGIKGKYFDQAGRPRLNIICYALQNLCKVLDACDGIVQKDSGSSSEWKPAVIQKDRTYTVKLHIQHTTEIYQKEPCGAERRLVTKFDASELSTHLKPRTFIDAFFSLEPYDYQQSAGIRSVAKKLILLSN